MSRIDDLLNEHCREGVEVKALGQVGQFIRGNGLQKKDFVDEGAGCIHYGQIYTHYGTSATETKSFVSPELAAKLRSAQPGDLVVATTSENDVDVAKGVAWLGDDPVAVSGDSYVFKHSLDPLYAAYFFQTDSFQQQKRRFITGTKVKRVSGTDLARIEIPVPPLRIQREIVAILTKMESLEAELEAELEARRRQYAHYRDALLSLDSPSLESEGRWMTLGEVIHMRAGSAIPSSLISADATGARSVPCFGGGGHRGYVDSANHEMGRVMIGRQGALCGKVSRSEGPFFATEHAIVCTPRIELDESWLFHLLAHMNLNQHATRSAQPGLAVRTLERLRVLVPTNQSQQGIGTILDRLEELLEGMDRGLPAEISARRQQYKHYRDRLFDFSRSAA